MSRVLPSALLLLALAWPAFPVFGQADQAEPPPPESEESGSVEAAPAEPEQPETAPTASLARSLQEGNARIRKLRAEVAAIPATESIDDGLPALTESTEKMWDEHEALTLNTLSLHRLDLMHQQWSRAGAKLETWQEFLDGRSNDLSLADQTLHDMSETWESIATSAEQSQIPEELFDQVRSVQTSIEEVDGQIKGRLSAVLVLLGRVTELQNTVTQAGAEVEAARLLARKRIFAPDSPSLWDALVHRAGRISLAQQVRDTWNQDAEQFRIFMNVYRQRVRFQALLFLALSIVMLALWYRVRKQEDTEEDPAIHTAHLIFSRPFSAALILTVVSTRLFYPHAPIVIFELNILLVLIPVLRLVPRLTAPGLRSALYGLSGLFVIHQFHALTADETLLQRLLLLLTSLAGLAGAIWIVRPGGRASTFDGGRWWKVAVVGIRIAVVLFLASVLANLVGSVALAEMLNDGTLTSAFGAVGLAAVAAVLRALLTMFMRSSVARASGMVSRHEDLITRRLTALIRLAALAVWLAGTLKLFRLLEVTLDGIATAASKAWTFGSLTFSIGSVLAFFTAIVVSVYFSRFVRFVLEEDVFPRLPLQRGVPSTLSMLINYSILALGFISAMAVAGFEISQFAIIFGALGVGIGFGLQSVVNNFISGLILVFERPVKVGDTIEVGTMIGEVRHIGIRASTVRTFDGAEVIVPNGNLISAEVVNWTLSDRIRRIKIPVGVAYGTDPQKVLDLLHQVAKDSKDVLSYPEPTGLFKGFGESSLDFELRVWTANFEQWMRVGSNITVAVNTALAEAGITIPFPQHDLHLRTVAPEFEQALARAKRLEPPADER